MRQHGWWPNSEVNSLRISVFSLSDGTCCGTFWPHTWQMPLTAEYLSDKDTEISIELCDGTYCSNHNLLLRLSDVMFRYLSSFTTSIVRLFAMFFVLWYLSFFRTPFIFFFVLSSYRRLFLSGFISRRAAVSKWDARLSSILDARQVAEIHFLSGVSVLSNVFLGSILDVQVVCVVAFQEGRLWENTCGSSRR